MLVNIVILRTHRHTYSVHFKTYNWKFRGATVLMASVSSDNFEENACQQCNINDTLSYLELRPGSPTVSIQKLPVIVGACHCFHEMILCRALKFVHEGNEYTEYINGKGTLHIYQNNLGWAV